MTRGLIYRVYVHDEDGNVHAFDPGGDVPGWARKKITNKAAWGESDDAADDEPQDPPPADPADPGKSDGGSKDDDTPPDPAAAYADLKAPDLKAEIARRNEGREADDVIEPEGKKNVDLIAALVADDAAQADAGN